MHKIGQLITRRNDRVTPETSLREVAENLLAEKISAVVVVEDDRAIGVITERDIVHAMRQGCPPEKTARSLMSQPVHSVPADTDYREAYQVAASHDVRRIVVTGVAGEALGIVNEADFRQHLGPDFFLHLNTADSLMDRSFPRLPAETRLDEAMIAMEAIRGSCVVVVEERKPLGLVTEHDIVRLFLNRNDNPSLGSIMTQPAISIAETCPLSDAAEMMAKHRIRHLTVVDHREQLVGLLSEHALMRPLKLDLVDDALAERQELARSQEQLQVQTARNERYQRALLDNFPFPVWLKDTESRFLTTNRAVALATGYMSADALIGKTDLDLSPPELADHYRADDIAVMASRQKKSVIEPIIINGRPVWHETYKAPVLDERGELLGTVGFARDISDKKNRESAMLLRTQALAGLIGGESLENVLGLIAEAVEAEIPEWTCRIRLQTKPLTNAEADRRTVPIVGTGGEPLGVVMAEPKSSDQPETDTGGHLTQASKLAALVIDHQYRSQKLNSSLETFHRIFDSVGEALFVQDEDGSFLDANAGAEQLFGIPRAGLIGQTHEILCVAELNDMDEIERKILAAVAGTPQCFETLVRNSEQHIFPVEVRLQSTNYFGRQAIVAAVADIAERKNAALRMEVEHALAQALAAGLPRDQVMSALLKATLRFPEIAAGGVYWQRPDGGYQLIVHEGLSAELAARIGAVDAHSPLARMARQGGTLCNCSQPTEDCTDHNFYADPIMESEGLGCLVALPIMLDGQPVACLNLIIRNDAKVSPATLQSLDMLSHYLSQGLRQLAIQEAAQRQQQNLLGLFNTLKDFIFIVDLNGRILHYNRAVVDHLGYGPKALIGQLITAVHPKNQQNLAKEVLTDILAGRRDSCPLSILRANGEELSVETRVSHGYWDGKPAIIGVSQDISERLTAEARQQLAASVFDNAHEGIMITDAKGRIVEVNATFSELTGYSREEAIGQTPELLKSGHHEPAFYADMWQQIHQEGFWRGEIWNRKKSGEIFVEQLNISSVRDRDGNIANFVAIFSDITVIKQHQQRLEHLAHFDALTQLPNRMLLGDRMQLAMAQTERSGKLLAVYYLDLDNFKPINDQFGHSIGDYLLIEVAQRLKTCVRAGDTVSRLGGDEFVLLIANLENVHECDHAIHRVISALAHPFHISQRDLNISASIGVTLYPLDGADSDTLLRHADQAMYAAKQNGRNRYHLFDPENDRRARNRREEIGRIREALEREEFVMFYQPKVDMRKGHVIGAEALIRWQHPEYGLLAPDRFLPAIEGTELAIDLGDWVIRTVLRQVDIWRLQGLTLSVSINISGEHLQHAGFAARFNELLGRHPDISPTQIELEVLETAALEDIANTAELIADCRRLGVSFSLDDFGTGYSSLTYFRRLAAETLKIDQSFVRGMLDDPDDLAIVEGVIGLTKAFQRKVIAEGVETVEHGLVLLLLGCDVAQGFGIARPMPAADLPAWIRQFQPDSLWSLATAFQWSREDLPMLIAEVDHNRWKKALYAYLDDTTGLASPPPLDCHVCRLGKWYHSPESQRYAGVDSFATLGLLHRELHELASRIIQQRRSVPADRLESLKSELESLSNRLSDCIQQIQAEVLLSEQIGLH